MTWTCSLLIVSLALLPSSHTKFLTWTCSLLIASLALLPSSHTKFMTWTDDLRDLKVMYVDRGVERRGSLHTAHCGLPLWLSELLQYSEEEEDRLLIVRQACLLCRPLTVFGELIDWIEGVCLFFQWRSQSSILWIMRWKHDLTAVLNCPVSPSLERSILW